MKVLKTIILSIIIVFLLITNSVTTLLASRRFIGLEERVDTVDLIAWVEVIDIVEVKRTRSRYPEYFADLKLKEILKGDKTLKVIRIPIPAPKRKKIKDVIPPPTDYIPPPSFKLGEDCIIFVVKYPWSDYFKPFDSGGKIVIQDGYVSEGYERIELSRYIQKIKDRIGYVNQLELSVSTDKQIYHKTEPIVVTVKFKNLGSDFLKLILYNKVDNNKLNYKYFRIYLHRLKDYYPILMLLKLDRDGNRFSKELKPQEEISVTIPLTEKYKEFYNGELALESGDYELDVQYLDYDWVSYSELANEGFWAGTQKGNRVRIRFED